MCAATVPMGTSFASLGVYPEEIAVKEVILTPEGLDKLKGEIEHLSTVKRREVAERIKHAREFGDIAEEDVTFQEIALGTLEYFKTQWEPWVHEETLKALGK